VSRIRSRSRSGFGSGDSGVLISHSFEDGTIGDFIDDYDDGRMTIINDPTGEVGGKVLQCHFDHDHAPSVWSNVSLRWSYLGSQTAGLGHGESIWFRGRLFFDDLGVGTESYNRKLLYWQPQLTDPGPSGSYLVLRAQNLTLIGTKYDPIGGEVNSTDGPTLQQNTWYWIEMYAKMNTANGNSDGIYRVYVNGIQVIEVTNARWLQASGDKIGTFLTGDQTSDGGSGYDELRFWDSLAFATRRIGTAGDANAVTHILTSDDTPSVPDADTLEVTVTAKNAAEQTVADPTYNAVESSNSAIATGVIAGSTLTITGVGEGSCTLTVSIGAIEKELTVTVTAAEDLVGDLQGALGDGNIAGMYLTGHGVTSSLGVASAWADARGSGGPTLTASGSPAYTAAGGMTLTNDDWFHAASQVMSSTNNLAMIVVMTPDVSDVSDNDIAASAGVGATSGYSVSSYTSGGGKIGALVNGTGPWISSNLAWDASPAESVFTLRRVAGTWSMRKGGAGITLTDTTAPIAPGANTYIGWNGTHGKFVGNIKAVIFISTDPGTTAIHDAEVLLGAEYGITIA
jgi:hypothetical protein